MQIELSSVGGVETAIPPSVAVGGGGGGGASAESTPAEGGFASVLRSSIGTETKTGGAGVVSEAPKPGGEGTGGKAIPAPAVPISGLQRRWNSATVPVPGSAGSGGVAAKPLTPAAATEQEMLQPAAGESESYRSDAAGSPLAREGVRLVAQGAQQACDALNFSREASDTSSTISGLNSGLTSRLTSGQNARLNSRGLVLAAKDESFGVTKETGSVKKTVGANAVGIGAGNSTKAGVDLAGLTVIAQAGEAVSLKGTAQLSDVSAALSSGQTIQSGPSVIAGETGGSESATEQGAQLHPVVQVFQTKPDLLEEKSAGGDGHALSSVSGQFSGSAQLSAQTTAQPPGGSFVDAAPAIASSPATRGRVTVSTPVVSTPVVSEAESLAGIARPEPSPAAGGNEVAAAATNQGLIAAVTTPGLEGPKIRLAPAGAGANLPQGVSSGVRTVSTAVDAANAGDGSQSTASPLVAGGDADLRGASGQGANSGQTGAPKALSFAPKADSAPSAAAGMSGGHAGVQSAGQRVQVEGVVGPGLPSVATAGHGIAPAVPQSNPAAAVGGPALLSGTSRFAGAAEAGSNSGSASDSNVRLLHASPQAMEVGVLDGDRGWLEVRAERAGGNLTASLAANSSGSAEALSQVVPDLAGYLRDRHIAVEQILVSGGAGGSISHGTGGGQAGGMAGGMAGSMTGGRSDGMADGMAGGFAGGRGNSGETGLASPVVPGVLEETGFAPVSSAGPAGGAAARTDVSHDLSNDVAHEVSHRSQISVRV